MSFFKKLFSGKSDNPPGKKNNFAEGDIFYTHSSNQFHIYKLLSFDKDFDCYHVLIYEPINKVPGIDDINGLEVAIYHSPIDRGGFMDAQYLASTKLTAEDLIGYHEYLRQTQEPEYFIPIANQYYQEGFRLTDEKMHIEAIDAYSKAIDLVPHFFEAIDNRAFCKMDLGLWAEAIEDFQQSLAVQPGSFLAEFSIGECYLRLKDYQKAKEQFEKAAAIDPAQQAPKDFLKIVNDFLGN